MSRFIGIAKAPRTKSFTKECKFCNTNPTYQEALQMVINKGVSAFDKEQLISVLAFPRPEVYNPLVLSQKINRNVLSLALKFTPYEQY